MKNLQIVFEDMERVYNRNVDWEKLYGKTVLITGAYGMLASYAVYMLIYLNEYKTDNYINIIALGRSENRAREKFNDYFEKEYFHFIQDDMTNIDKLDIKFDYVIHAASFASPQHYAETPVDVTIPNILGSYKLLELAKKNDISSFLFISSGEVYGNIQKEEVKENEFGTSDPLDIRYCYGESKRMAECLCNCYYKQYGVPIKIVRLGHTYGPTVNITNDQRVFSEFSANVARKENIIIKSSGNAKRAFCYAADAVAAFYIVLLRGENGEAYNIANKKGLISIKDLAEILVRLYPEDDLTVEYKMRTSESTYIESRQLIHSVPSTEKLEKLGWECEYSIEDGFRRTIDSLRLNL